MALNGKAGVQIRLAVAPKALPFPLGHLTSPQPPWVPHERRPHTSSFASMQCDGAPAAPEKARPYHALLVSLLDRVPCNGRIAIILWWCPREGNILSPDILNLHKLGRTRTVYRTNSWHNWGVTFPPSLHIAVGGYFKMSLPSGICTHISFTILKRQRNGMHSS